MKKSICKTLLIFLIGCLCISSKPEQKIIINNELSVFYEKAQIVGAFVFYDVNEGSYTCYNSERCSNAFLPASTFKILNSLIALETKVIEYDNSYMAWDSINRPVPSWNKNHNLETAFQNSVVWYYQELARRIGRERMEKYINLCKYGNKKTGPEIDMFWLRGDLRITPFQQIEFIIKLFNNELPFKLHNIEIVKKIMVMEETSECTLRAKTGWALNISGNDIGWYVGYLECKDNTYIFANNIDIPCAEKSKLRKEITLEIFKSLGIIK